VRVDSAHSTTYSLKTSWWPERTCRNARALRLHRLRAAGWHHLLYHYLYAPVTRTISHSPVACRLQVTPATPPTREEIAIKRNLWTKSRGSYIELISDVRRETVVKLPFAADCCPCVEKLRTVLPFTVGIRDGAVQLKPGGNADATGKWGHAGSLRMKRSHSLVEPPTLRLPGPHTCQILPLPICRYRFKFQSNLFWDSIKSISNFCFQF
jgi:hypothetical protein